MMRPARSASGQDLALLAFELVGRDDAPVAQVGQLAQLVRSAFGARSLLDVLTELLLLKLRVLLGVLMHLAAAGDQVHQNPDQREEQDEDEPQRLGPTGQVMAAEKVDEYGDQDPEPDHPQEDHQDRPERTQYWVRVTRSEQHAVSLAHRAPRKRQADQWWNVSSMIVLGAAGRSLGYPRRPITVG